jgi:Mn2+/Fe2+ NRAMP family transporter
MKTSMISEMKPNTGAPGTLRGYLRVVGPGIVVAATGVGAGDLVAAAKAGANFGLAVLWCAAAGAVLKFALAEGVARWQLATGTTVLEGWVRCFGRAVHFAFLVYFLVWTFVVSAALMSACGLAAHALFPRLSVKVWAMAHGLFALLFVWTKEYEVFERAMKIVIGVMFVAIVGSAAAQAPPLMEVLRGISVPEIPGGSTLLLMGVIGGVGGTVTLLSYNYWIREKGWSGPGWMTAARFDLGVGYLLTGIFGVAVILLAGVVLEPKGVQVEGQHGVLDMAGMLGDRFGRAGEVVFLVGFWGAVATSILGVWQGVPYLFGNYAGLLKGASGTAMERWVSQKSRVYRGYALFMTFPPMVLLFLGRPVWLIVVYAALGALFMPFLAATLLYMNNRRREVGALRSGLLANGGLVLALALFAYLAVNKILSQFSG